jgi:hypothetical protein
VVKGVSLTTKSLTEPTGKKNTFSMFSAKENEETYF